MKLSLEAETGSVAVAMSFREDGRGESDTR